VKNIDAQALDNGQRARRKLLTSVVRRLVMALKRD
jgi:hypothetical protein